MSKLGDLLADILRVPSEAVGDELAMAETDAWDSLAHMDIVGALEDEYAVTFTADEMVEMTSVKAIRQTLMAHGVSPE